MTYLVPIHVPVFGRGSELSVSSVWARELELLRDSFDGRFGDIVVVAPRSGTEPEEPTRSARDLSGVRLVVGYEQSRIRHFWTTERRHWTAEIARLLPKADVVHATTGPAHAPAPYLAFRQARKAGLPTVYVLDKARGKATREEAEDQSASVRLRFQALAKLQDRLDTSGVRSASLAMLKEGDAFSQFGSIARNPLAFFDTVHTKGDIRCIHNSQRDDGVLRLVYFGQLIKCKEVWRAVQLATNSDVALTIIGNGPDRESLEDLARVHGARVHLLDAMAYGPAFFDVLRSYDVQVFPSVRQDTPRSVFDGFAAGLPLLAARTAYTSRLAELGAPVTFWEGSINPMRASVEEDRARAIAFAAAHTAELTHERRAAATIDAVERHRSLVK